MKPFEEIFKSFSSSSKAKISDPLLGGFIGSWLLCNWSELALLFFGDGNASHRIKEFDRYLRAADLFAINRVFAIPLFFTLLFVLVFPWISLLFKKLQNFANDRLHQQDVSIELNKIKRQEVINKHLLLTDPTKRFLESNVEIDIDKRRHIIDSLSARRKMRVAKAEEAAAEAELKNVKLNLEKIKLNEMEIELEAKNKAHQIEKERFSLDSSRLSAAQASSRYPSAHSFVRALDQRFRDDGASLSVATLGEIVARVFGYVDFSELLSDTHFNNQLLTRVRYIQYDSKKLAHDLMSVMSSEEIANTNSELLFEGITSVFRDAGHQFIDDSQAFSLGAKFIEEFAKDLRLAKNLYEEMSGTGFKYKGPVVESIIPVAADNGYVFRFEGEIPAMDNEGVLIPSENLKFSASISAKPIVGSKGLSDFKMSNANRLKDDFSA